MSNNKIVIKSNSFSDWISKLLTCPNTKNNDHFKIEWPVECCSNAQWDRIKRIDFKTILFVYIIYWFKPWCCCCCCCFVPVIFLKRSECFISFDRLTLSSSISKWTFEFWKREYFCSFNIRMTHETWALSVCTYTKGLLPNNKML